MHSETLSGQAVRYMRASAWCWKIDFGSISATISSTGGTIRLLRISALAGPATACIRAVTATVDR